MVAAPSSSSSSSQTGLHPVLWCLHLLCAQQTKWTLKQETLTYGSVPAIEANWCVIGGFFIKSLTCAPVCGYWLEPNVSCAGSGFIRSCCYWKWIPWAIWIQLIQLNTVNNWSDSETEPCHMGAVTSSFAGLKPYSCAAGLPRVVCSTISPLYLITACEGHKADHEHRMGGYTGIIMLSKSLQWQ